MSHILRMTREPSVMRKVFIEDTSAEERRAIACARPGWAEGQDTIRRSTKTTEMILAHHGLNGSQAAVIHAASHHRLILVHGPPGTGKTRTSIALVDLLQGRCNRVGVAGPTNISIDTFVDGYLSKTISSSCTVRRLGHESSLIPSYSSTTRTVLVEAL